MNCSDLEKFGAMLRQPELKQWDIDNNFVETIYSLELIEQIKNILLTPIYFICCYLIVQPKTESACDLKF